MGHTIQGIRLITLIAIYALLIWSINFPGFSFIPNLSVFFLAVVLLVGSDRILIDGNDIVILFFALTLLILSTGWFFLFPDADFFQVLRMFRFFIAMVSIWLISHIWNITFNDSLFVLIIVLLIHAFALALQIFSYELKLLFAALVGLKKEIFVIRGFGLTSAYDTAGALLCFVMLFIHASKNASPFSRYSLIVFVWAVGFSTGRTFMIVGSAIFLVLSLQGLFSSRVSRRERFVVLQFAILVIFIAGFLMNIFSDLVLETIGRSFDGYDYQAQGNQTYSGYYAGSGNVLADASAFNITDEIGYLIGTGKTLHNSDLGFLKTFYTYGFIVGSMLSIYFITLLYFVYRKFSRMNLQLVGFLVVMIFFVYNVKMQSFYSSGYSEIMLLLLFSKETSLTKSNQVPPSNTCAANNDSQVSDLV